MRTNFAGFALSLGMGLIVLLIGFVALSAAGLVSIGPASTSTEEPTAQLAAFSDSTQAIAVAYKPATPQEAAAIAAGEGIFRSNCAQCHAVNEKVVGPALAGIDRRRSSNWIVTWVHNSAKLIASGDVYAAKIYQENSQQQMPSFLQLSDKDVAAIIAWVKSQEDQSMRGSTTVQTVATR